MTDLGSLIQDAGGAVGDLFKSQGNAAQARDFTGAADLATQNAALAAASTRIQEVQTARSVSKSLGTTEADVAGAGFTTSGSALDILKDSAQQGALAKSLVNIQGAINENSYAAQAGAYKGEAAAANEATTAGTIGAIASLGGALVKGGQLASAGKTVVKGVDYVSGLFDGAGGGAATGFADGTSFASDTFLSTTDTALSSGANLSLDSSIGSSIGTDIGLDTSGFSLGTSIDAASSMVGDAFDSISSLTAENLGADFIPGVGEVLMVAQLLDMIPGFKDIPVIGGLVNGVVTGVSDVVNGVVSVVGDIGSAIGSVFGSVICTALYKRGMLTRQVWFGAQKYGRDVAPEHVYRAYLLWGKPIADMIAKRRWFAKLVAPVFVPWAHELAVLAGEKTAVSTLRGRIIFKTTYAFSSILGKIIYRRKYATA